MTENTLASSHEFAVQEFSYGEHYEQKLDLHLPDNPVNAPIIFMVHGGAWQLGDKAADAVVKNKVARWLPKGFVFISVNYRLLPEADPLQQADDIAMALAFVQKTAKSFNGDGTKIILMGHSSGAHIVSVMSSSARIIAKHKLKPWLGSVVIDTAVLNVEVMMGGKHFAFYDRAFGADKKFWRLVSPFHLLSNVQPPLLIICSTKRKDELCDSAETFATKARALGINAKILPVDMTHWAVNRGLGKKSDYTKEVESFMRSLDQRVDQALRL
ncbi:MAG: alpha/beta hydrolase [Pseudomonadales bacterium]|nr:alpha/beta hydrolase [Pseudomonadales bacterium]